LSREIFVLLEPALQEVSAVQGTVFLESGEPIDRVYFPQSGMVSLLVVTNHGGMIETSTVGREGAVGLHRGLGARRSFNRATVQIPGRFSIVAGDAFQKISLGSASIREMIVQYTEALWAEAQQLAACNTIHQASARLCRWLLQSADRVDGDELPLTQDLLAQMLGVRRTTVTALTLELQNRGIIQYTRGKITILDRKALEDRTCECYHVIRYPKPPVKSVGGTDRYPFAEGLEEFTPAKSIRLQSFGEREGIKEGSDKELPSKSEAQLRWFLASILESSDAIIGKDLNGIITSWNKGAESIFGYSAEEAIGKPLTILIPPDRHDEEPFILERVRRGEKIDHYETVRQRKEGSLVDISLSISAVRDDRGTIIGASKIVRDITQRKQSEKQAAILAREAEHRTRNILATVMATVELSRSDSAKGLKAKILGRIQALANVHALFVESRWAGAELSQLVAQELSPYNSSDGARAIIDGPKAVLEPNVAQALAVIVHELATNAAKYGALSVPGGRVEIKWARSPANGLAFHWMEVGGPSVTPPTRRGLGRRVMETLIQQIGGTIDFDWREPGLSCEVVLPEKQA
jgi:PAS domain S-box-containing protein